MYKLFVGMMLCVLLATGCSKPQNAPSISEEKARDFANVLYNRQLYRQSAAQYEHLLDAYSLNETEQAKICYTIGDIYFERLKDYENALTYYLRIKHIYTESSLVDEANKKIIACLERLERSEDAVQALEETTTLEPEKLHQKRPGAVVARIGKRDITQGDIDFEIGQMPPYLQQQINTPEKKLQFLKQYILTELLYDKAKRERLDSNPEIVEAAFQAKKGIMVRNLIQKMLAEKVKIEEPDVELYYNANKSKYVEKDANGNVTHEKSFDEVKHAVAQDLAMERQQEALEKMTDQLMTAESAQIFSDKVQ
jgi:hypothetical protein